MYDSNIPRTSMYVKRFFHWIVFRLRALPPPEIRKNLRDPIGDHEDSLTGCGSGLPFLWLLDYFLFFLVFILKPETF